VLTNAAHGEWQTMRVNFGGGCRISGVGYGSQKEITWPRARQFMCGIKMAN